MLSEVYATLAAAEKLSNQSPEQTLKSLFTLYAQHCWRGNQEPAQALNAEITKLIASNSSLLPTYLKLQAFVGNMLKNKSSSIESVIKSLNRLSI
jgi:hypothetical protein